MSDRVGLWASVKRTAAFWGRVVQRALKDVIADTPLVSPLRTFIFLSSIAGGLAAWLLGGTAPPYAAELALVWAAGVIVLAILWKLISVPSKLTAEDNAKHDAELAAVTAERDAAVGKLTAKPLRDERYNFALSVFADVTSDIFAQDPIPMKLNLKLSNRGTVPIEYQTIEYDYHFGDGPGSSGYGQGGVLRQGEATSFHFKTDPSRWVRDGVLHVAVKARYGQPHGRPSRFVTKVMRVQYSYMNALTQSVCHTVSESEDDIPEAAIN